MAGTPQMFGAPPSGTPRFLATINGNPDLNTFDEHPGDFDQAQGTFDEASDQ